MRYELTQEEREQIMRWAVEYGDAWCYPGASLSGFWPEHAISLRLYQTALVEMKMNRVDREVYRRLNLAVAYQMLVTNYIEEQDCGYYFTDQDGSSADEISAKVAVFLSGASGAGTETG